MYSSTMKLTEHFTMQEMCASSYAVAHKLDNMPQDAEVVANLTEVCMVLEHVRKLVGAPINVSSGYRSPKVNTGIGGSRTSAHMQGLAADVNAKGVDARKLALLVAPLVKEFGIDQLIYEVRRSGATWVHVGLSGPDRAPRHQVLTMTDLGGKLETLKGVV